MNTTTIIRQIKEYMGAYGKAYTLLYLGAVTILTSCVKDDLYAVSYTHLRAHET